MDQTTEEIIGSIRQWSIDRIHELSDGQSTSPHQYMDAVSIAEEFDEWIECEGNPDNEFISITFGPKNFFFAFSVNCVLEPKLFFTSIALP